MIHNGIPPVAVLSAPAKDARAKVRSPAGARFGPSPFRRSRFVPIKRPIPSATAKIKIKGSCWSIGLGCVERPHLAADEPGDNKSGGCRERSDERRLQRAAERRDPRKLSLDPAKDQESRQGQRGRDGQSAGNVA
jgi:hypothetical protein